MKIVRTPELVMILTLVLKDGPVIKPDKRDIAV